jgi:CSLREA domain-containing protein
LTLSVGAPVAYAATISVNTTADELNSDGDCSLREAIEAANTNSVVDACAAGDPAPTVDVIGFSVTGTITLGSTLPAISETLTIDGPGAASLTISGGGTVGVLQVSAGTTLNLERVTVADGSAADDGGGILNSPGATLTVTNTTVSANSASDIGGGIANFGTLTVTNSTFSGNSAGSDGGGISTSAETSLTVTGSTFSGNSAGLLGGGINSYAQATMAVTDSTFTGNSAGTPSGTHGGGGIRNAGTLTVTNSTFSGNTGAGNAGAIDNWAMLTVTNSTFSGNSAGSDGGAIRNFPGVTTTVTNSTFSGNSAGVFGGGIQNQGGTVNLLNSIVANSSSGGNCSGTITDGGGNLQHPGTTCGGTITSADPLLDPAGLQDNGGSTETIALQPGSPAIDTAVLANCPATDQRGISRPQGPGCEIGAFEVEVPLCTLSGSTLLIDLPSGAEGEIVRAGVAIVVSINGDQVDCGSPTIGNVDTLQVTGTIETELLQLDLSGGRLEPGATAEGTGTSEIEVQADLGGGSDTLVLGGTSGADTFRLGTIGANLNADDDGDDVTLAGIESITVNGAGGNDKLSAEGGLATGSALAIPVLLNGDAGNDKLTGGTTNDVMNGGAGKDACNALKPADGTDVCNGGSQTDTTSYAKRTGAVSLDPDGAADDGSAGENDTTATDVENLTGGKGGDTLVATATGGNVAKGGGGNDTITVTDGISGNDIANGGGGIGDSCTSDSGDVEIDCET